MDNRHPKLSRRDLLRLMDAGTTAMFSSQAPAETLFLAPGKQPPANHSTPIHQTEENIIVDAFAPTTPLPQFRGSIFAKGHASCRSFPGTAGNGESHKTNPETRFPLCLE